MASLKLSVKKLENGKEVFEDKIFTALNPKARTLRMAIDIVEKFSEQPTGSDLDRIVLFVVELFGKQFTPDDVWDGVPARGFPSILLACVNSTIEDMFKKVNQLPNGAAAE